MDRLKQEVSQLFKQYREDYNMTLKAIAEEFGVTTPTVKSWKKGTSKIRPQNIKKIEEHFDVKLSVPEYAMYKGNDLLAVGTLEEISQTMGIQVNDVLYYATPSYLKKNPNDDARRLIRLEEPS